MATFKVYQDAEGRTFRALEGSDRELELLANPNLVEQVALEVTVDDVTGLTEIGAHLHIEADITDLDKYTQAEIDAQQATQDTNISTNMAATIFNTAAITTNTQDINTNTDNLVLEANTRISEDNLLSSRIDSNEASTDDNAESIITNAADIATNAMDIDNNEIGISANLENNTLNSTNIASNDVDIAELQDNVDSLNNRTRLVTISGRFEIDTDDDWACWSDPNFGPNLQDWDLDLGNGATPNVDFDGLGMMFPAGTTLKRIFVKIRANNNDADSIETFARVHDVDLTQDLPIDSIAEINAIDILEANLTINLNQGAAQPLDMRAFEIPLGDYVMQNDGDLHLMMRSTPGSTTANRQLRCTMFIEYILPEVL